MVSAPAAGEGMKVMEGRGGEGRSEGGRGGEGAGGRERDF